MLTHLGVGGQAKLSDRNTSLGLEHQITISFGSVECNRGTININERCFILHITTQPTLASICVGRHAAHRSVFYNLFWKQIWAYSV